MVTREQAVMAVGAVVHSLPTDVTDAPPPARFAALIGQQDDRNTLIAEMTSWFKSYGAVVRPLSDLDHRVIVIVLPRFVFAADEAAIFEAGYLIGDAFGLRAVEPDIPTDLFKQPVGPDGNVTKDPARESLDSFPPGCWAPEEPVLDARPRWALEQMRVEQAWAYSRERGRPAEGAGIVIAQPDTGITAHPELAGVASVRGFDFIGRDSDVTDPMDYAGMPGHGTATASVVVSGPAGTVTGSAPRARHMPIRAIQSVIRVTQVTVAEAIEWAVANGAHVITLSLGGIPSFSLHRALRRAAAADVIVLAAAGNCVRQVVFPARYGECIAVAGTNAAEGLWRGTCRGSAVDISAPAQNVIRARAAPGGAAGSGQGQGTSFAVALTAGVAALWLAHHGRANLQAAARASGETLQSMFLRLVRATARRPAGWDSFAMGAGIVDARALLEAGLETGLERETVAAAAGLDDAEQVAVESLALDMIHETLPDDFDYVRYGPELGLKLLRLNERAEVAPDGREAVLRASVPPPSVRLARQLTGTRLAAMWAEGTEEAR